jgi:phosphonate metabolism-associated iron-containing alcohol dehydrogenase
MADPATWRFHNPVRITFGEGTFDELSRVPEVVGAKGDIALITTGGFTRRGLTARAVGMLGVTRTVVLDDVRSNPELHDLRRQAATLAGRPIALVVAIGGGSALDSAKVLALGVRGDREWLRAHLLDNAPLPTADAVPLIAIPTTAGTGSEVTPFATVWDGEAKRKLSVATPRMLPAATILDPRLTVDLPEEVTVSTGLDALAQALESVWNRNATTLSLAFANRSAGLAFHALPALVGTPRDLTLRAQLMEASLLAGLAISVTRTALAHSMSYPITAHHGVPHGLACGFTLPEILRFNGASDDGRLAALSRGLGFGSVEALAKALEQLLLAVGAPGRLRAYCADPAVLTRLTGEMTTPGRADNNLRAVDESAMRSILERSIALRAN